MTDNYVITMQFYFTPVENILGSSVTLSGPPPPPSRIESDSAEELERQQEAEESEERKRQQEEEELKRAFTELVGREYIFPLEVKAVDNPDTKSE